MCKALFSFKMTLCISPFKGRKVTLAKSLLCNNSFIPTNPTHSLHLYMWKLTSEQGMQAKGKEGDWYSLVYLRADVDLNSKPVYV